jgi:hypothetical protein
MAVVGWLHLPSSLPYHFVTMPLSIYSIFFWPHSYELIFPMNFVLFFSKCIIFHSSWMTFMFLDWLGKTFYTVEHFQETESSSVSCAHSSHMHLLFPCYYCPLIAPGIHFFFFFSPLVSKPMTYLI